MIAKKQLIAVLVINFQKIYARFFRKQIVSDILHLIQQGQFGLVKSIRKIHLSFDAKNFKKCARVLSEHFFKSMCPNQILKCKSTSFKRCSSWNEVTHVNYYKTYTAKTSLTFLEECLSATLLKHVTIIEECATL